MTIRRRRLIVLCIAVTSLAGAASASAAQQGFMRITGVHGETQDSRYALSADINYFSFAVTRPAPTGGGGGTARASFGAFAVNKRTDSTSPFLFEHAASGATIPSIRVVIRSNASGRAYLQYCLEQVTVTAYRPQADGQTSSESVSFSPGSVEMRYLYQKPDGSLASPVLGGWNIVSNTSVGFNNNCAGIGN